MLDRDRDAIQRAERLTLEIAPFRRLCHFQSNGPVDQDEGIDLLIQAVNRIELRPCDVHRRHFASLIVSCSLRLRLQST